MRFRWPLAITLFFCLEFVYAINIESRNFNTSIPTNNIFNDFLEKGNIITSYKSIFTDIQLSQANVSSKIFFHIIIETGFDDDFMGDQRIKSNKKNTGSENIKNNSNCFLKSKAFYKSPSGCHFNVIESISTLRILTIHKNKTVPVSNSNSSSSLLFDKNFFLIRKPSFFVQSISNKNWS